MTNRVFICVWITCIFLATSVYASNCKTISLYSSQLPTQGSLIYSSFPENPEWKANWGQLGELSPPYIRFSGLQNKTKNWKASLSFPQMPLYASDGFLEVKIRATQNAQFKMAMIQNGIENSPYIISLKKNETQALKMPILTTSKEAIEGISIELIQVPANQYTTLFIGDISFSCASSKQEASKRSNDIDSLFTFSDAVAEKAIRTPFDSDAVPINYALKKHSDSSLILLKGKSLTQVVLSFQEHLILQKLISEKPTTAKQSWKNWNESLYYISKNRLSDSSFANPKAIFRQANDFSASYNYQVLPILIGSFLYEYVSCDEKNSDSVCTKSHFESSKILISGFGSSFIYGSKVEFILDPYFVSTNQKAIPEIELFLNKEWVSITLNSQISHSFDSLGIHSIPIRLRHGSDIVETTLLLEVR